MNESHVNLYRAQADRMDRDPYGPDGSGRAVVVNGRGFQKWRRFHLGEGLVSVFDDAGREWYLTPKQAQVFDLARTHYDEGVTMRSMSEALKVSPSTISRAMWKLQAIGLLAFIVGRGRYAGMVIVRRAQGDGLERLRKIAKAKVREWSRKANERVLRMKSNVASYYSWREVEASGYGNVYVDVMNATLMRPWTADDLEGVV